MRPRLLGSHTPCVPPPFSHGSVFTVGAVQEAEWLLYTAEKFHHSLKFKLFFLRHERYRLKSSGVRQKGHLRGV